MFSNSFSVVDASCAGTVSLNCKRPTGLQLLDWIQAVGMSLSSLSVDRSLEVSLLTLGPAVYYATLSLLEKCLSLRRLYICRGEDHPSKRFVGDLLQVVGDRLYELFAWDTFAPQIAKHCAGLRSLRLESEHAIRCNLLRILRVVGPTLETFVMIDDSALGFSALKKDHLLLLRKLCPNLTSVSINIAMDCADSVYVDFLCSYGAKLRFALLWGMSKDLCEQFLAQCPNLEATFHLDASKNHKYWNVVPVLAPSVKELLHVYGKEPLIQKDLETATRDCVSVERIEVYGSVRALKIAVKALFRFEKSNLKSFLLDIGPAMTLMR